MLLVGGGDQTEGTIVPVHSDVLLRASYDMLVLGSNEWAIYDGVRVCDHI
jgi:hypothetical protein